MLNLLTSINKDDYFDFFKRIISASLIGAYSDNDFKTARDLIYEKIWLLLKQSSYYYLEEKYVEPEWKEMISLHYINTTYSFDNYVCRVHLFSDNKNINDNYLGFFTLRKINEPTILFSKLYPNWNNLKADKTYVPEARVVMVHKEIHFGEITINILTTPYFVQDGVVCCCAHSNLIMFSEFLNVSFGTNKILLSDIINSYYFSRERSFPTKGLFVPQICETFYNNGISVDVNGIVNHSNKKMTKSCIDRIKSQIDSNIPVIMGFRSHAVLIIGYYFENNNTHFVFYDDSGYLVSLLNDDEYNYSSFIYSFDESIFFNKRESFVFFFFQPERVYTRSHEIIFKMNDLLAKHKARITNTRVYIADISLCKSFLKKHCIDETRRVDIDNFAAITDLHYAWCYELEYSSRDKDNTQCLIYFLDSTFCISCRSLRFLSGKINTPFPIDQRLELNGVLKSMDINDPPRFFNKPRTEGFRYVPVGYPFSTNVANIAEDDDDDFIKNKVVRKPDEKPDEKPDGNKMK